ncbi:FtsK/SpoIIIE domain-containing protein [Streptomyces sp. NPDC049627]|uniref:FtsK/SpoIIIE domain-containing protein n=1 Tax=Streptomyces sp. NPDC049627 TaxID=3365595 RepID=UPI0037B11788
MFSTKDKSDHVTSAAEAAYEAFAATRTSRRARMLRAACSVLQRRAPYFAPGAGAVAWGGWIYTEAWLTDPSWQEPVAYGATGILVGVVTGGAAVLGIRQPAAFPALYGGTVATGTLLWSSWQVIAPSLPGAAIGLVGAAAASFPFWGWLAKHRLDRDKLEAKAAKNAPPKVDLVLAPDDVAGALEATGTPGAALEQMLRHPDGSWTAILSLPVGVSPRDIASSALRVSRLEAALRLAPGWTLEVVDGGASHHLIVTARPPAPEVVVELPTHHPLLDELEEWDPWQPLLAAIDRETGEEVYLHLLARAGILVAGLQRMGKSVLLSVIVAHLALTRARLILVDGKLVELSMWAPLCQYEDDFVGRDPLAFLAKLLEVQREIDRRYAKLVRENRTKAEPDDGWEPIALIVDELATFIDIPDRKLRAQIISVLRDVLSRGPACLVPVVVATQKPQDNVIPSQIRDVCGQKVALATTTPEMTETILGRGWVKKGADAHDYGEKDKGRAVLLEDGSRPRRVQTFPFEPPERHQVIDRALELWPERPGARVPLPDIDDDADPRPEPPTPRGPGGGGGGGGGRPVLRAVPTYPDGSRIEENRLEMWQALEKAGPEGLTKGEAVRMGICNHHSTITPWLNQWLAQGWVEESGKRDRSVVFVLSAPQYTPVAEAPVDSKENARVQ